MTHQDDMIRREAIVAAKAALKIALHCTDRRCKQAMLTDSQELREASIAVALEIALQRIQYADLKITGTVSEKDWAQDGDCADM